jgi:microcystin-dependent protein
MASVLLSPVGNGQQFFDNNGVPLNGGLIYQYQAGSSTLLTTYTTVNGTVANANPIVLDSSGRPTNEIWMQTGYSYKFIIQTSTGTTLQTLDNLYPILQNAPAVSATIPSGLIAIWSGSLGSIPSGWVICDGTNSTPDLRNSFILGAGNTYAVGTTGGSTDAIVVSHNHTLTDPGHSHSANGNSVNNGGIPTGLTNSSPSYTGPAGISISTAFTGITLASAGTSGTNANMPPYYALAFIMKS